MTPDKEYELWFVTGSQHLYGKETLEKVANHSQQMVDKINQKGKLPVSLRYKPVVTSPEEIAKLFGEANNTPNVIGVVAWMHTFSPAKMWISGLSKFNKPWVHLHTQYNRDIPWEEIDMDFMNLNQSAHGDREFGYMGSRLRLDRKVIVGHWEDPETLASLEQWSRAAIGWHTSQNLRIARLGDNMREVAVTEGDKVEAQIRFGWSVNGYAMGDLVHYINQITDHDTLQLCNRYEEEYDVMPSLRKGGDHHQALEDAARIELGLRAFLEEGGFHGFTDTFENLYGLKQLPGLAVQRLMKDGYGFGAEGDWKMAAMLRVIKMMAKGLPGGNSFMEDYTYHFDPEGMRVLGAHMLEICPSLASQKPALEIHDLGIGGKEAPVRLVFPVKPGNAINVSLVDLGNRFRLIVNEVKTVLPPQDLPNLPVARVLWEPLPDLKTAAAAWIYAGGSHHTVFSQNIQSSQILDFAEMLGIECILIDNKTSVSAVKEKLRWNEVYYHLMKSRM